jgi:hypothetical protein
MVTPTQLETLLNGLLENEEKLPYSFHIEEQVQHFDDHIILGTSDLTPRRTCALRLQTADSKGNAS